MESLVSRTSTASREVLGEELTSLRALLRLNADGVGDEADLLAQLNQTRAAIDQFCAVLCERRDILTPESLPPASPSSSNATSPRLSLDSQPSWRSSRTSQLSFSSEGDSQRRQPPGGRTLEPFKELRISELVEDWTFEIESPVQPKDEDGESVDGDAVSAQDDAFKRLSTLLASLQAQAEAAVSAPSTPLKDFDLTTTISELDELDSAEADSTSPYRFPADNSSPLAKKRASKQDFYSPPNSILRASFRRTNSLPYSLPHHNLSTIFDDEISSASVSPSLQNTPPSSPPLSPVELQNHRRITSASLLSLPPKCTLRSPLNSPPLSACSSPRNSLVLSRRGSTIIRDMGLETLLGDIIETANKANQAAAEHQTLMTWVWTILFIAIYFMVGTALKWNCECPQATCKR
ncbi:hypothetical protein DFH27DRAFT_321701 [Peziza echinospora]|nr:hypothetical protein DFH27DRAFT_321701 [Peziza echinospora]